MSNVLVIDLFVEDRAHEEWLRPLMERLAREENRQVRIRVRSARGGHGRVIQELKTYQRALKTGRVGLIPDLLVAAIDGNCSSFTDAQNRVQGVLQPLFADRTIKVTPDPHIERWFLADPETFHQVVGITPRFDVNKCERDYYKNVLAKAVTDAGHPATLGGIEFARELVEALDWYRAGKSDSSLKHFLDELRGRLRTS
jgi:hypothetical protein